MAGKFALLGGRTSSSSPRPFGNSSSVRCISCAVGIGYIDAVLANMICGARRKYAQGYDAEGDGPRGHQYDLADLVIDESSLFRQVDADHGDETPAGVKPRKIPESGGDDEADTIHGEEAVDARSFDNAPGVTGSITRWADH